MTIENIKEFERDINFVERRFGRIDIAKIFYECQPDVIKKVFEQLLPVKIDYDYSTEIFNIIGVCDKFEMVELGNMLPHYIVTIKTEEDKEPVIEFKKR
jgi:hypothetical protein